MSPKHSDPGASGISRLKHAFIESKLLDAIIRWLMIALVGSGAGFATQKVGDANETAIIQDNREQIKALEAELQRIRSSLHNRITNDRKEHEAALRKLHNQTITRLTRIETKLHLSSPILD